MRIYPLSLFIAASLLLTACHHSSHSSPAPPRDSFDIGDGPSYTVWAVAPAANGKGTFYVGGQFAYFDNLLTDGIVRLNANGTIDPGFYMGTGFNGSVFAITPATDGSGDIYVGGAFTTYNGFTANHIVRLNANGSMDTGFSTGTGFNDVVYAIKEAADGSGDIYVGGDFTTYNGNNSGRLARLNSDGSYDSGFNIGAGASDTVNSIAVVAGGSGDLIYIGGNFTYFNATASNYIARIKNDGSYDTGFAVGTGFDGQVETLTPAADGSGDIYVGGDFKSYDSNGSIRIARLNSDGSFDSAFATSTGFNDTVYAIATDSGVPGEVFVAGLFTTFDGNIHQGIACLNSTGFICSGFNSGVGFDYAALTMAFANDGTGDLFVGGDFLYYQGVYQNSLVRLNSSGAAL